MKRFIIFLISALAVMLVSAWTPTVDVNMEIPVDTTGVEFDDTGFDYYAKDYGYIHLSREGNVVTARLNDIPEGGFKLRYEAYYDTLEKPSDEEDGYSRDTLQAGAGIDAGKDAPGLGLTFKNTEFDTAMNYFLDEFVALGFKPVEVVHSPNTLAFDCGCTVNADVHMRVVFTERGEDVFVHISAVE